MANDDQFDCAPDFSNYVQLQSTLIGLMDTRGKTSLDRLEREFDGVQGIAKRLHSSTEKGLIGIKDGLTKRQVFGLNISPRTAVKPPQSFLRSLFYSLTDSIFLILVMGAVAALILGSFHPEICGGIQQTTTAWMEGIGILGTVVFIIMISAVSDYFRDFEFYTLQERLEESRICTVVRSGEEVTLRFRDIMVGDLCLLKTGTIIPADGVLIQINELIINESAIGGQANVVKGHNEDPLVFSGSYVSNGSGKFMVIAVGKHTQDYKRTISTPVMPTQSSPADDDSGTLQGKLNKASAVLGLIGVVLGILVALIIILRFSVQTYSMDGKRYDESHWIEFVQAIILGIVVIIIAEPEGLTLAVTISLSYCIDRMHANNIVVRNVDAVEKMGNLTTVCCGKTGVLTELSEMNVTEKVEECYIAESFYRGNPRYYKDKLPFSLVKELCDGIAINSSYSSNVTVSGPQCTSKQVGDRTECALLQFALDLDEYYPFIRENHPEELFVKVFNFSSERKSMTTVIPDGQGFKIYSKGAPDILQRCTSIVRQDGSVGRFIPEAKLRIDEVIKHMQEKSHLKVMCLAYRHYYQFGETSAQQWENEEDVASQLTLLGLVGIETVDESSESRKRVVEGTIVQQPFWSFQGLKRYKKANLREQGLVDDLCRGITVNTSYSSNIKSEDADNLPRHVGDSIDCALLQFILEMGETYQIWRDEYPEDTLVYRSVSPKGVSPTEEFAVAVIHDKYAGTGYKLYCRGSPSYLLPRCTKMALTSFGTKNYDEDDRDNTRRKISHLGKRKPSIEIVCLASKYFSSPPDDNGWEDERILSDLIFTGFVGIEETIREQVPDAISDLRGAGIKVCMVTADNLSSAASFGSKSGLLAPTEDWNLKEFSFFGCDSRRFKNVDQNTFDQWWPNEMRILATAGPGERLKFINHIKYTRSTPNGEVVAVTASGVNDDKVLKTADVGLTMGVTGTDVAKESADIVLQDDNFSSIVEAVKWGRNLYESILKYLQFQFTVTWVAIIVVVVGACVTTRSPLSATQLLWVNLIMDALASLALTRDPPSHDVLIHKPYGQHKPLVPRMVIRNVIFHSIYQLAVMFVLMFFFSDFLDMRNGYDESSVCRPTQHGTMVFTTFVFMTLFNEINCRRLQDRNVFKGLLYGKLKDRNFVFIVIWILTFGIQLVIVQIFTNAFRVVDMEWDQWMWCLFFGFSELIWAQLVFTIPKSIIPRKIRCCSSGISENKEGCWKKFSRIRGISKVRKQNQTMYVYGHQNGRSFENVVSPGGSTEFRMDVRETMH